jgi:hypothetical protein
VIVALQQLTEQRGLQTKAQWQQWLASQDPASFSDGIVVMQD